MATTMDYVPGVTAPTGTREQLHRIRDGYPAVNCGNCTDGPLRVDVMASDARLPERDRPWVMRTYAGHSSAAASNALYRRNLGKGQTGLSVAFDLPTQTGYDPDHVLARV